MTALPFRTFDECLHEPPKTWAIKGVMALDEDSSWWGKPGSLKSALLTDIIVHLAAGRMWRGHKIKRPLASVFCAFERAGLTRRRLAAYAQRDGLTNLTIAVCDTIIDLIDIGSVETVVDTVKAVEDRFRLPVGVLVFDTYAKGVAAGGGDEDKGQHANVVAANMKLIHERLSNPVHIATIGHSGWTGDHERGSSAKLGHVDLSVQVSGDIVRTAKVVKGNDQAEGPITSFTMEAVSLGQDADGEPLTVGILSKGEAAAPKANLTPNQTQALSALDRLGERAPLSKWKDELLSCGVVDKAGANPRAAFKRIKDKLKELGEIDERDDYVWLAGPGKAPLPPPLTGSVFPPGYAPKPN